MDKLPYSELEQMITTARKTIRPGSKWQHYKGTEYIISDIVIIEETNQIAVVYTSVDHPVVSFVRPLNVWQETVDWNDQTVPRFKQI